MAYRVLLWLSMCAVVLGCPTNSTNKPTTVDVHPAEESNMTAQLSGRREPPPRDDTAAMARYIVHTSNWTSMATISTRPATFGAPFANVFSVADGGLNNSSGVPYMYLTDLEMSVKDLNVNNNASLSMSLAQADFCSQHGYDPESPLCSHIILSGEVKRVNESDDEYTFAHDALFSRHPEMATWPAGHHWFVAKLELRDIIVLDFFGGPVTVSMEDYFAASPFTAASKSGK